jgi:hypothetical protein
LTLNSSKKALAFTLIFTILTFSLITTISGSISSQSVHTTGLVTYPPEPEFSTVSSTELINYAGMTTADVNTFITTCYNQGFTELTLRLNAFSEWSNEQPSSNYVAKAKEIITEANAKNISINIDLHTWYTTWDSYFRDSAPNCATNRDKYLNYVQASINAFNGFSVKAWMVMNEPQARTATTSENNFILNVINTAKSMTSEPVSVRFMCGYSPTTGHYSSAIDEACDFICRNTYWDPRNPSQSVYGTTQEKMNTVIAYSKSVNKELWITEFGKSKNDLNEQQNYVAAFVEYSIEKEIDRIFCWVSQPEGGGSESYNIFNGYTPNPAFYELINSV